VLVVIPDVHVQVALGEEPVQVIGRVILLAHRFSTQY
jgi:hypothetical protein